ncbi:MAG: alpha/beta fold hydrolase [Erysipelotrichaceae bacterium]|jgi:pimeloyl-ACP methyl ester carboxylesterase
MMQKKRRKTGKRIMRILLNSVLILLAVYFSLQGILCLIGLNEANKKLQSYGVKTAELSYGNMTYLDENQGEVILSVHGIFGGYDQAYETVASWKNKYRLIAPSRFGYLGSDIKGKGTPEEQAQAYIELLDLLKIEKVFVLATSAGGTPAIRLALDYPERVKGLILYCSAMPVTQKPESFLEYQAPPEPLLTDYGMYLISPLMPLMMGMPISTVRDIQPVAERRQGVVLDGKFTNPDMERNFDDYPIENMTIPVLILHAEDDNIASYEKVNAVQHRFKNLTLITFPTGGHMMIGHGEEIKEAVENFITANK